MTRIIDPLSYNNFLDVYGDLLYGIVYGDLLDAYSNLFLIISISTIKLIYY